MSEQHTAAATSTTQSTWTMTAEELRATTIEAYVFGYPMVLMDAARAGVASPGATIADRLAPTANRIAHTRRFPDHDAHDVAWPDADTLHSTAFLDLRQRPLVLSVPEMAGRYYAIQVIDGWTNVFASLGTRTTGGRRRHFALVGPDWLGVLPTSLERIDLPTNMASLAGRIYTAGPTDYHAVHVLQDQCRLRTLAQWGRAETSGDGADATTPRPELELELEPRPAADRIAELDARAFFSRLAALMVANPPAPEDRPLLERVARIGLRPGRMFTPDALGPDAPHLFAEAIEAARRLIAGGPAELGRLVNGWRVRVDGGRQGAHYLLRAAAAGEGIGAELADDVVPACAALDEGGRPLDGRRAYEIRFARGALPPVHGFWSLSLYGPDGCFVKNPAGRQTLGDRDPLRFEPDGSLALTLQHEPPPVERQVNWLPTPEAPFNLMLRLYWPQLPILEGRWAPPSVRAMDA
jgi:hypothetical protein